MEKDRREKRKKTIVELMTDELYVPMKEKELAVFLQVDKSERDELKNILDALLEEGKIELTKKGKYIAGTKELLSGIYIAHPKGFGFVEIEGRAEDYYIPEDKTNAAYHNDTVLVEPLVAQRGKRQEAQVVKIIKRGMTHVVGTYQKSKQYGFVIPDHTKLGTDIFIPLERSKGAVDGHIVVVELTSYGSEDKKPEGKVVEILGHRNDPGVDILAIVKGFELPMEFPEKVMNQAERVAQIVSDADREGRKDLRSQCMVTIDGEDAKDLDDAVSLERIGEDYVLGVHIADVANYVQENSALDKEALNRGTSVYLVDRVIPMLPHILSNGICSLNAGEDRLALSCIMRINPSGEIVDYEITESVIKVNRRMSYTEVAGILSVDEEKRTQFRTAVFAEMLEETKDQMIAMFEGMQKLAAILKKKRQKRGSIDFDLPETKILLDEQGHPISVGPYDRNEATKIIEDFMLAANETVAQHFYWLELPFVYRTHDLPDPQKIEKLRLLLQNYGHYLKSNQDEIHPKEVQKLLQRLEGTKEEALISRLTLRSMKQARYSVECTGHFGLACQYYSHFTSPIRRYPDLQIHRIIKEFLRGRLKEERIAHYNQILPKAAKQSSDMERRAQEAERETDKLKKAEYMEKRIGNTYDGVISGIMSWGIYVELENTIEGMIHVSKLPDDYFYYDAKHYEMVGETTNKKYQLGQPITVLVADVDTLNRTIDFSVAEEKTEGRKEDGERSHEAGSQQ